MQGPDLTVPGIMVKRSLELCFRKRGATAGLKAGEKHDTFAF